MIVDSAPILSIRDLSVIYLTAAGAIAAVSQVNLEIARGDFVALVGQSGSGKSTLAASLIGLLPKEADLQGSIRFRGQELVGLCERDFSRIRGQRIGLVPQDPAASLNPTLTVGRQVAEVFALHAKSRLSRNQLDKQSIEILELAGIDRPQIRLKQYPHELSGGLKQRVLIAMAFGLRPDLLIADEPTSALDVTVQKHVLETFNRLAAKFSTAVLFVTHDLAIATDYATRAAVMHNGAIVEQGAVGTIVREPQHAYTQRLLVSAAPHFFAAAARPEDHAPQDHATLPSFLPSAEKPFVAMRATNLFKTYPARDGSAPLPAVENVSFEIRRGATFSLVGESGSGKTTTARMTLGLIRPNSGAVEIGGRALDPTHAALRRETWRNIQYVYQNPWGALDPRFSIGSIIAEPLNAFEIGDRRGRRARVRELLEHVALSENLIQRRPRDLSGGQRQRVALARALALEADIIVLDEPLSALDVVTQAQIIEMLKRLQGTFGLSYLFISHDLAVVREISDDVGVMHQGRMVETGPVEKVFSHPASAYTKQLLDAIPGRRFGVEVAKRRLADASNSYIL